METPRESEIFENVRKFEFSKIRIFVGVDEIIVLLGEISRFTVSIASRL